MASSPPLPAPDGAVVTPGGRDPSHLLDVLEMLPLDTVVKNIWRHLSMCSQRSFKLTCRRAAQLVDHLICIAYARDFSSGRWQQPQEAQQRVAFLSRLPHLCAVELWGWCDDASFTAAVHQLGDAAGGRVTSVALRGGRLHTPCMAAIHGAFPQLQELEIEVHMRDMEALYGGPQHGDEVEWVELERAGLPAASAATAAGPGPLDPQREDLLVGVCWKEGEAEEEEAGGGVEELQGEDDSEWYEEEEADDDTAWIEDDAFHPLHNSHLTKLVIHEGSGGFMSEAVLRSLGGLSRLQHLDAHVELITADLLAPLCGLVSLHHCQLWEQSDTPDQLSFVGISPLFASTHLTLLQLWGVPLTSRGIGEAPDQVADALSQLGALANLRNLGLGYACVVDDALFGALRRLSGLTELLIERMQVSHPTGGGHLPLLQHLWLKATLPCEVLQTMQPLLPLPSLTSWDLGHLELALHYGDGAPGAVGNAEAQAAALATLSQHLAAAPHLQLDETLHLFGMRGRVSGWPKSVPLAQVAAGLGPLAGRFSSLSMDRLFLNTPAWDAMHQALPGLQQLALVGCYVPSPLQAVLALPGLTRLRLLDCEGPERHNQRGWRHLAAQCARPLQLAVGPPLPPELVAQCRQRQRAAFGTEHIQWMYAKGR